MYDIKRLKSQLLFMKIEINSNFRNMSASQIYHMTEKRLNMKEELRRLLKLKERKDKIRKLKSKL